MARRRDVRTGLVGYRPAEDPELRLKPGVVDEPWRSPDMIGTGGVCAGNFVVPDPDQPGRLINPYPEVAVGRCEGRCGRASVLRRPVADDGDLRQGIAPHVAMLCDDCLLADLRGY